MGSRIRTRRFREAGSLVKRVNNAREDRGHPKVPLSDMDSNVGWTVTSLEVENSILSSALRSIPPAPSAMIAMFRWKVVCAEGRCNRVAEAGRKVSRSLILECSKQTPAPGILRLTTTGTGGARQSPVFARQLPRWRRPLEPGTFSVQPPSARRLPEPASVIPKHPRHESSSASPVA